MIGVIGGSGVYTVEGLSDSTWTRVVSPFGEPSDLVLTGTLDGVEVAFLPRHGRAHRLSPSEINYRANIDALKRVGVTDLISVSAVGSLRGDLAPGTFVIVDQFIDRTHAREKTFFSGGCVAHVSLAKPVCQRLGDHLQAAAKALSLELVRGGTYVVMEGPQFSTKAESELYRQWGCDVIGMTNMPEAKLAREAEICYAPVAMVTDFDCWHPDHDHVTIDQIISVVAQNSEKARSLIAKTIPFAAADQHGLSCACKRALDNAIVTPESARAPELLDKLDAVAGRVLTSSSANE